MSLECGSHASQTGALSRQRVGVSPLKVRGAIRHFRPAVPSRAGPHPRCWGALRLSQLRGLGVPVPSGYRSGCCLHPAVRR